MEAEGSKGSKVPWGVVYGTGFGALTASRIAHEAHLQGYYINSLGIAPSIVGAGWTLFCAVVALAEPAIGVALDTLRSKGVKQSKVLFATLIPWLACVFFIWNPFTLNPPLLFVGVVCFGLLQATMNLGFLSFYPSLFPSKEARAKALVPQQAMTIAGLMLGMTMPAIVSNEWQTPYPFAIKFTATIAAAMTLSIAFFSQWKTKEEEQGPEPRASLPAEATKEPSRIRQLMSVVDNGFFRTILIAIFFSQLGNALLASTLPLFARQVMDLSHPVGPFLGGLIPSLDSKWQFSVCYFIFYTFGTLSGAVWSAWTRRIGATSSLRTAFLMYALGCAALPLLPGGLLAQIIPALGEIQSSPTGKFLLFAVCYSWNGFALGGMVALPDMIIAEAVTKDEEDRKKEGKAGSRAGAMYGSKQLVYRMASAFQGVVTGSVMTVTGYKAGLVQAWSAKYGLCALVGFIPAVCYILAGMALNRIRRMQQGSATENLKPKAS